MSLGKVLKKLRGSKTLLEVSKHTGIGVTALSNYENNYRVPKDENKKKLAKFYNKTVGELFYKEKAK